MRIGRVDINKLRGRAAEQLRALRKQVEAARKDAKAEALEQRQKAAQRAKAS